MNYLIIFNYLKFLDDLIQECNKDVELKIPEMGQHYVTEWAMDQNQEQSGAVSTVAGKSKTSTGSASMFCTKKNTYL